MTKLPWPPIAIFLIFTLVPISLFAFEFEGTVVKVEEGDQVKILDDGHFYRIKLVYVYTPQPGQKFSKEAQEFTEKLLETKVVKIKTFGQDRYGRILGEIFFEGKNLGHELVKLGLAWEKTKYSEDPQLIDLQKTAKKAKKGLWSQKDPTPPWKYRK